MSVTKISKKSGTRYRARIRTENGKQISKVFRRKVDAEAWEREQLRLRDRPDLRPPKAADLTIEELFTAWRKHHASRHLAPSTAKMYLSRINRYILPAFGDMLATEIVVGHLDDWMGELEALELHPKTINDTLTILGGLYRWGMKRFDLPRNPCADVQKLTIDPSDFDFWSQGEVEQFLDATIEHPYRDAFVMAINTGARFGELTGLKWDCVHFGRNQLVISRSWCQASSKLRNRTKGGKTRNLPMNATVRDLLLRRKSESQSDFVLTNADGIHKLPNRLCGDHFRPACLDAGVRVIRFHDLRHTFASHFMMAGGNLFTLQKLLGHSDVKTTQRYAHLSPEHLQGVAGLVEFGQPKHPANVLLLSTAKKK